MLLVPAGCDGDDASSFSSFASSSPRGRREEGREGRREGGKKGGREEGREGGEGREGRREGKGGKEGGRDELLHSLFMHSKNMCHKATIACGNFVIFPCC